MQVLTSSHTSEREFGLIFQNRCGHLRWRMATFVGANARRLGVIQEELDLLFFLICWWHGGILLKRETMRGGEEADSLESALELTPSPLKIGLVSVKGDGHWPYCKPHQVSKVKSL